MDLQEGRDLESARSDQDSIAIGDDLTFRHDLQPELQLTASSEEELHQGSVVRLNSHPASSSASTYSEEHTIVPASVQNFELLIAAHSRNAEFKLQELRS